MTPTESLGSLKKQLLPLMWLLIWYFLKLWSSHATTPWLCCQPTWPQSVSFDRDQTGSTLVQDPQATHPVRVACIQTNGGREKGQEGAEKYSGCPRTSDPRGGKGVEEGWGPKGFDFSHKVCTCRLLILQMTKIRRLWGDADGECQSKPPGQTLAVPR